MAENVKEKARANFCDYFVLTESELAGLPDAAAEEARKSLDKLFKK